MPQLTELQVVLPTEMLSDTDALSPWTGRVFPTLRGLDVWPPNQRCAGCFRVRVEAFAPPVGGDWHTMRYRCSLPLCPVHLVVALDAVARPGDALEENALQLKPRWLRQRSVERWEVPVPDDRLLQGATVTTLYYAVSSSLESVGLVGVLLRPFLPFISWRLSSVATHDMAIKVLKRHWQALASRESLLLPARPGTPQTAPAPRHGEDGESQGVVGGLSTCSSGGLSIATEGIGMVDSPNVSPSNEALLQPSLTKGMPFHNGFLYKLGDGILNTTWNLRYFLLIGQTLQYYRSQHEARPRDALNLSGVTVEWLRDQSRPFTFTVSKSGSRSYCLSGCSEQDASEWMERIQAASKISERSGPVTTPNSRRPWQISTSDLPEAAQPGASTWQEAKMKHCSEVLMLALQNRGLRLREMRHGLRIFELQGRCAGDVHATRWPVIRVMCQVLLFVALLLASSWVFWVQAEVYVSSCFLLILGLFLRRKGSDPPVLMACACFKHSAEEIKEALSDHWRFQEWQPDHLEAQAMTLLPSRDEGIRVRFRTGVPGYRITCDLRRRWARHDGARLLLCVEESQQGDIRGFEGFAIKASEDGCAVLWLSSLDLASWAPRRVQEELLVRRISALAGLREWLSWSRTRPGPKMSGARGEQKLNSSFGRSGAMLKDSLQLQVLPLLLRPFRRAARRKGASLESPHDLDRATLCVDVMLELVRQALRGGREVGVQSKPNGVLPQALLGDFAQRLSGRWAFPHFLSCAGHELGKDRMAWVMAFMVSGLHLAAAGFPHLPWQEFACSRGRHTAVLPEDCIAHVDIQERHCGKLRSCDFEVTSAGALAPFRVHGTEEVQCQLQFPGSFSFQDHGSTTVEFGSRRFVRFTMPVLEVSPSGHCFGAGSIFQWTGTATFIDDSNLQCRLHFRPSCEEDIYGLMTEADGTEVACLHGSWLGPFLCNGEVLWKGPGTLM